MSNADAGGKAAGKKAGKAAGAEGRAPEFEESIRRLEAIVGRLEAGELPLEETLRLFEEGQTLVRNCSVLLERAELRVKELLEGTGETRDLAPSGAGASNAPGEVGPISIPRDLRGAAAGGAGSGDAGSGGAANQEGMDA
jgi:exodeoxyribonuclease VII small subunit